MRQPSPPPPLSLRALALAALAVAGLLGCRQERLVGERPPIAKAYHSFTAHYNGYFNAAELVEEAEIALAESRERDYDGLLPVFPAYSVDDASGAAGNLDQAMEKVSLVVNVHRPSAYEDDSYLLLGRAQLLKQDYEAAQHTFEWAIADFDPANEAARLKRIDKEKRDTEAARAKEERAERAAAGGRGPAPRSRAPKSTPKRRSRKPSSRGKSAGGKKKSDARSSSRSRRDDGPSEGEKRLTREERMAAQREARLAEKAEREAAENGKKSSGKRKSRAEMAREQREARLAEEKAAARAAEKAAEEAAALAAMDAEERAAAERAAAEAEARAARLAAGAPAGADEATGEPTDAEAYGGGGVPAAADGDEQPPHGLLRHETSLQDLNYWLARTYIARERYVDAERVLRELAVSGATFDKVRRRLPAAYAELHLAREEYDRAVPFLEDAVEASRRRADRARYTFLLGQLHERLGHGGEAYAAFERVVELKPEPEMSFHAQLRASTLGFATGTATATQTLRGLRRMSREDKYAPYRDRIFYAMAEVALEGGDTDEAIGYLQQSLAAGGGDQRQAAKTYLRLGELFLAREDFVAASAYYDSTMRAMPEADPLYEATGAIRDNLGPVAAALATITLQDSLIAVSRLPGDEQRALATEIQKARRKAARDAAIAAARAATARPSGTSAPRTLNPNRGGDAEANLFFAYNDKALRRGEKAFERTWGARPPVDNWRTLSQREATAVLTEGFVDGGTAGAVTDEQLDAILAGVPKTDEDRAAADAQIEAALLVLGRAFREKLDRPGRARAALDDLLARYPGAASTPEALYLLALAQDDLAEAEAARATRRRLCDDHPASAFARSLCDPDFDPTDGADADAEALASAYEETYGLFGRGDTTAARARLAAVAEAHGTAHALAPRFALLGAMVEGRAGGREAYLAGLKAVVADHPDTEEATRAQEMLRLLGVGAAGTAALAGGANVPAADAGNFALTPDKSHYLLAALPKGAPMAQAKAAVADYNGEHHRLEKLAIGNVFVMENGVQTPVIVVRRFKDQAAAMAYHASVTANADAYMGGTDFAAVVISQANYREVLRSKSFAEYLSFFQANYL